MSSVSVPTMWLPRLTLDSLAGASGGVCWSAQKDAPASSAASLAAEAVDGDRELVRCGAGATLRDVTVTLSHSIVYEETRSQPLP